MFNASEQVETIRTHKFLLEVHRAQGSQLHGQISQHKYTLRYSLIKVTQNTRHHFMNDVAKEFEDSKQNIVGLKSVRGTKAKIYSDKIN